ncbi:MAG: GerW family sporulation protein [Solirubrobacteraceae bacterium]
MRPAGLPAASLEGGAEVPRFTSEGRPDAVADEAAAERLNDPATAPAAEEAMRAADGGLAARLAERLSRSASAEAVFGAPVERADITVIPVARARYGFGAGTGDEGSGGGGGMSVTPVGWIEITAGGSRFKPLRPSGQVTAVILAALGLAAGGVALRRASGHDRRQRADAMIGRVMRRMVRMRRR